MFLVIHESGLLVKLREEMEGEEGNGGGGIEEKKMKGNEREEKVTGCRGGREGGIVGEEWVRRQRGVVYIHTSW